MLNFKDKLPHALLLVGDVEKEIEALLSSYLPKKQMHPDVHHYHPEGKSGMHPIESLKELQRDVALEPFEAPYKFFIIHDAERMLTTSANALLKTLEEPAAKTVLILATNDERALLPTIRSRCQTFRFPPKERPKDPLEETFFHAIQGEESARKELEQRLEKDRKKWEKELLAKVPDEMTALQREGFAKEIEGAVSLRYQTRIFALFETLLIWQRDALAKRLGSPHLLSNRELPFTPLSELMQTVRKVRIALMRGMKFATAFDFLMTKHFI
ncbi:MAG: hypothetical protein H7A36_06225 [Chlamydiales bacterium]|nr:hypothetical protein [Chlamydiales bacterium]